jgi:hypothetical protein
MRSLDLLAASKNPTGSQLATRLHSQREAYMPEDNPARKSFEAGARAAREAAGRGTAAVEQGTRQTDQSYTSVADGIREFNAKLLDIASGQYDGRHVVSKLTCVKPRCPRGRWLSLAHGYEFQGG